MGNPAVSIPSGAAFGYPATSDLALDQSTHDASVVAEIPSGTFVDPSDQRLYRIALPPSAIAGSPRYADVTFITKFDPGHGWAKVSGSATVDVNSTERPLVGTQAVKYGPSDPGNTCEIQKTGLSINLANKTLVLWFYAEDSFSLGATLYLGSTSFTNFRTYAINPNDIEANAWSCIKVHVDNHYSETGTLDTSNVQSIKLGILDPTGTHTIHWAGFGYIDRQADYPNGVVTLAFDDGVSGIWPYGRPKLEQYGYPAVLYVNAENIEGASGNGPTVENLHLAEDMLGWEICGHADRNADHVDLTSISTTQAEDKIARMKQWLQTHGFRGNHFAYPFGFNNAAVRTIVARYFSTARTVTGGLTQPNVCQEPPVYTRRWNIPGPAFDAAAMTVANMQTIIDIAKAKKLWITLIFHQISTVASSGGTISQTDFNTIIDYINSQSVGVATLSTIYDLPNVKGARTLVSGGGVA